MSFVDVRFWLLVMAVGLVLALVRSRRTTWFGLLNLVVLALWISLPVALAAGVFSVVLWGAIWLARKRVQGTKGAIVPTLLALTSIVLLFALHKIHNELPTWVSPLWERIPGKLPVPILSLLAALSFSYVALRAYEMSASVLLARAALLNPLATAGYLFPFHMLLSGPVTAYADHVKADSSKVEMGKSAESWAERGLSGVNEITTGLLYKFVVAEYLRMFAFGDQPMSVASPIDTGYLFVYLFFDFAGYSRVALGIGRLLGIPTPVNFRAPFAARTVTEFFTRWHISLGQFIQRNIYNPLQLQLVRRWGVKRAAMAGIVSLLAGWVFVGLWHRFSLAFLAYGLGMAGCVWLEKHVRDRSLKSGWGRHPLVQRVGYVLGPAYVFTLMTMMLFFISRELFAQ